MGILLLLSYLNNYLLAQNSNDISTGEELQADTTNIVIPISYIKAANAKLIERLYLKQVIIKKDSIILLKNNYIQEQSIIIKDFQNRINNVNKINLNLQKDIIKKDRRIFTWKCISVAAIVTTGVVLLTK